MHDWTNGDIFFPKPFLKELAFETKARIVSSWCTQHPRTLHGSEEAIGLSCLVLCCQFPGLACSPNLLIHQQSAARGDWHHSQLCDLRLADWHPRAFLNLILRMRRVALSARAMARINSELHKACIIIIRSVGHWQQLLPTAFLSPLLLCFGDTAVPWCSFRFPSFVQPMCLWWSDSEHRLGSKLKLWSYDFQGSFI